MNIFSREIRSLTGIRGVAASAVLLAHINQQLCAQFSFFPKIIYAQIYVDLFFILSGFVISYTYFGKNKLENFSLKRFYVARFARIYPLYLLALAIATGFDVFKSIVGNEEVSGEFWGSIVKQLLLVNALTFFDVGDISLYTSWSISIEWWIYIIVVPVVWFVLRRIKQIEVPLWCLCFMLVLFAGWLYTLPPDARYTRGVPAEARGLVGFLCGVCLFKIYSERSPSIEICGKYLNAIGGCILLIVVLSYMIGVGQAWIVLPFLPCLVFGLAADSRNSTLKDFFECKPVYYLGEISYSIYLLHPLILSLNLRLIKMAGFKNEWLAVVVFILASLGMCILIAAVVYEYFEKPSRDIIRRWASKNLADAKLSLR